jgi:hypothetical protein
MAARNLRHWFLAFTFCFSWLKQLYVLNGLRQFTLHEVAEKKESSSSRFSSLMLALAFAFRVPSGIGIFSRLQSAENFVPIMVLGDIGIQGNIKRGQRPISSFSGDPLTRRSLEAISRILRRSQP